MVKALKNTVNILLPIYKKIYKIKLFTQQGILCHDTHDIINNRIKFKTPANRFSRKRKRSRMGQIII